MGHEPLHHQGHHRRIIGQIVHGAAPYVMLMIAVMALVMIFTQIALWLPGTMFAR